jgi:hypothetical protein
MQIPARDMATINGMASSLSADIISYSGTISHPHDCMFVSMLRGMDRRKNVLLLMTTDGGSADAAYRMMRGVQHFYQTGKIYFLVIDRCKSAGTLMSVGADEIILVDDAELGPLDVQVLKPDELGEFTSGLTAYQALTALRNESIQSFEELFLRLRRYSGFQITTRTAADIAAKLSTGGIQKLYEQLDPMRIAEHQRAMLIAHEYGSRLSRGNLKADALDRLIADYPAHGFMIDCKEAYTLFTKVRLPTKQELKFCVLAIEQHLCIEHRSLEPKMMVITKEFTAIPTAHKKGKKHAKTKLRNRKIPKKTGRLSLPINGTSNAQPKGPRARV